MIGIKVRLAQPKRGFVWIAPISDTHIGSSKFDEALFKRWVDLIAGKPDVYAIGLGDITDCIVPKDKRFLGHAVAPEFLSRLDDLAQAQAEAAARLLVPLKGRLIAAGCGNHEDKLAASGVADPHKMLCERINAAVKTSWSPGANPVDTRMSFVADISVTRGKDFRLHGHHGWFAGSRGRKVGVLERRVLQWQANVVVGHGHEPVDTAPIIRPDGGSALRGIMCCAWKTNYSDVYTPWEELKGFEVHMHGPTLLRVSAATGEICGVFFGQAAFEEAEAI